MEKETIEEVAERLSELQEGTYTPQHKITYKHGFIDGAKWQAERSFTLEQIDELFVGDNSGYFDDFLDYRLGLNGNTPNKISFKEWFENFKKK